MAAISITAANVLASANAATTQGIITAATTVTQGQALYAVGDGTYGLAQSNGASPANTFAGIALTGGSAGQPVVIATADSGFAIGGTVWLSTTAGAITSTSSDVASGDTAIVIGVGIGSNKINLGNITGGAVP
jgi:hypothetical protein